ncbi:MAG: hypothetical protein ACRDD1_21075, partial [Planctomycetia bacterium]
GHPRAAPEELERLDRGRGKVLESLLGSVRVLCGLRYSAERVADFYRRLAMIRWEDSTTYMEVFEKGEACGEARGTAFG